MAEVLTKDFLKVLFMESRECLVLVVLVWRLDPISRLNSLEALNWALHRSSVYLGFSVTSMYL